MSLQDLFCRFVLIVLLLSAGQARTQATPTRYTVADWGTVPSVPKLGEFSGDPQHLKFAINRAGTVVAGSTLWRSGHPSRLGPDFVALDINDQEAVVGFVASGDENSTGDPIGHGWLLQKGRRIDLGDGLTRLSLNNQGQVALSGKAGFLWQNGKESPLLGPQGEPILPLDINDSGQWLDSDHLWDNGKAVALRTILPPFPSDSSFSNWVQAVAVNNHGAVCGDCGVSGPGMADSPPARTACLWTDGKPRDLGSLPARDDSLALGLNDQGQVVGACHQVNTDTPLDDHAFLWQNGKMTDLNAVTPRRRGRVLLSAMAINSRGQIACLGRVGKHLHLFLLTPIGASRQTGTGEGRT